MHKHILFSAAVFSLALTGCGGAAETPAPKDDAADFAARINAGNSGKTGQAAPQGTQTPTIAPPRENAAEGAYAAGTATDPDSATCGANRMGQFLGRPLDDAARAAIMEVASDVTEIRFVPAGADYVKPDPTNPRLNIMTDQAGIIRDARCG
ncbi:MAG: hypothetical protein WBA51_15670 [Erythrobacter sp.]